MSGCLIPEKILIIPEWNLHSDFYFPKSEYEKARFVKGCQKKENNLTRSLISSGK